MLQKCSKHWCDKFKRYIVLRRTALLATEQMSTGIYPCNFNWDQLLLMLKSYFFCKYDSCQLQDVIKQVCLWILVNHAKLSPWTAIKWVCLNNSCCISGFCDLMVRQLLCGIVCNCSQVVGECKRLFRGSAGMQRIIMGHNHAIIFFSEWGEEVE